MICSQGLCEWSFSWVASILVLQFWRPGSALSRDMLKEGGNWSLTDVPVTPSQLLGSMWTMESLHAATGSHKCSWASCNHIVTLGKWFYNKSVLCLLIPFWLLCLQTGAFSRQILHALYKVSDWLLALKESTKPCSWAQNFSSVLL